jgi:peptidoglycan-associated lipoprotein
MKTTFRNTLAASAILAMLTACSSSVPLNDKPTIENKTGTAPGGSANSNPTDGRAVSQVNASDTNSSNNPKDPALAKRSVYFGFDHYDVSSDYRDLVQNHAKYIAANDNRKIVVQGNTDERGGSEYNLALGQRRADAVRNMMQGLGVKESQIETVSFGKEKPKATGSNESAWAENRRADIVYP